MASDETSDRQVLEQLRLIGDRLTVLADRQTLVTDHLSALDAPFGAMGDRITAVGERVDLLTEESGLLRRELFDRLDSLGRKVTGLDKDVQALPAESWATAVSSAEGRSRGLVRRGCPEPAGPRMRG